MSISKIALAIPLSLGIACSTSGAQSRSDHTGAMWTESQHRDAATQAYMQGTGSQGEQEKAGGGGTSSPDTGSSSGSMGSSGSAGSGGASGPSDSGSMGSSGSTGSSDSTGSMGSSDSSGTSGSPGSMGSSDQGAGGSAGSTDQGTMGGSSAPHDSPAGGMAHSDDQLLRGKVSKVSKDEISITPKGGEAKTLKISPQTVVTINGKDAKPTQLKQGQQVRASYANQDGDDIAVKIEVGKSAARHGKPGGHMKGGGHDHPGHSGSSGRGMGGSGSDAGGGSR